MGAAAMSNYIARAVQDCGRIELRYSDGPRWRSEWCGGIDAITSAMGRLRDHNLYTTLNRAAEGVTGALCDDDVTTICRLPLDIDPERPTDCASTDAELAAALKAREHLVMLLSGMGWPMPALGMSGNGAHILYRCRVPCTAEWRMLSARLYKGLRDATRSALDALNVRLDTSVRNPARIWRLYGTINRKGEATPDRPHREATITLPAGPWQCVPLSLIERTAQALTPEREPRSRVSQCQRISGNGDYRTLDVVSWVQAHGHYRRDLGAGKHAVSCPWINEHTTASVNGTDTVVWESDGGWPTFHCSHAHCEGRTLRDVMALWGDADGFCEHGWRHG